VAGDARRIEDRAADCSEALLAVADVLGGQWPDMARNAGEAMVEDARTAASPFLRVRLLGDLALVFGDHLGLWTAEILTRLHARHTGSWARRAAGCHRRLQSVTGDGSGARIERRRVTRPCDRAGRVAHVDG
jgi:hypothetical protein